MEYLRLIVEKVLIGEKVAAFRRNDFAAVYMGGGSVQDRLPGVLVRVREKRLAYAAVLGGEP